MSTFLARCTALALGSSIAIVGTFLWATCVRGAPLHGRVERVWRAVVQDVELRLATQGKLRGAAARAELALLGDDGWPGVYRSAGKWPTELVLAPQAGFTLHHDSWCGNCKGFAAFGRVVTASEHELQLETELSHECATTRDHLATTLHLVRWGELLFAVTPQRVEDFCAAVTGGQSFPRDPVRVLGDSAFDFGAPTRPDARPSVPSEWQRLLPPGSDRGARRQARRAPPARVGRRLADHLLRRRVRARPRRRRGARDRHARLRRAAAEPARGLGSDRRGRS